MPWKIMVLRVNKAHSRKDLINMINVGSKKNDALCSSDYWDLILKNSVLTHFKCTIVREKDHAFAFESTGRIEVSQKMWSCKTESSWLVLIVSDLMCMTFSFLIQNLNKCLEKPESSFHSACYLFSLWLGS